MGRKLERVPLDFSWPLEKTWEGFVNPHYTAHKCAECDGSGYSEEARWLKDRWYGHIEFKPEESRSKPFSYETEIIINQARRNVKNSPDFYGSGEAAIVREAKRLANYFNSCWNYHLDADDVEALLKADRLRDFTHTWSQEKGWEKKVPEYIPTPEEVNLRSIEGMGHDSSSQWIVCSDKCKRLGVKETCEVCEGEGEIWDSEKDKQLYESWESKSLPVGEGYQMWETVSDGSPISPVFATAEELASWLEKNPCGIDAGTTTEQWLKFIKGPGWAPSIIENAGQLKTGVQYIADEI